MKVYNAQPYLRQPRQFLRSLFGDLWAARELAWRLFLRDLRARYRQSILGYFWVVFPPLALTGSFLLMQKSKLLDAGETPVPYALYALAGMLFWQTFTDAVNAPVKIVSQSKSMLVKLHFPRESLILAGMLEASFTFGVRLLLFFGCMLWLGYGGVSQLWALPLAYLLTLLMGTMLGVLLTPASILFQDFSQGLPIVLSFLLICTPVAYMSQPDTLLGVVNAWNPLSALIELGRGSVLDLPIDWWPNLWIALCLPAGLAAGWLFYRLSLPHIIARIGS